MDAEQVAALRAVLAPTGWLERTTVLARALRRPRSRAGCWWSGRPGTSRWHLAAHLDEEKPAVRRARALPHPGPLGAAAGAPPHLRVGMRRLEQAERGETVLVVGTGTGPGPAARAGHDARKHATVLALDQGDPELEQLAHEVAHGPARDGPGVLRRRAASGQLGGRAQPTS